MASWSDLNYDILEQTTRYLSLPDRYSLNAVCQNWGQVRELQHIPLPQQLPWLMTWEEASTDSCILYDLMDERHYRIKIPELRGQHWIGCAFGWLFIIDEDLIPTIFNPFSRDIYKLPRLPLLPPGKQHKDIVKAVLSHDPTVTPNFSMVLLYGRSVSHVAFWLSGSSNWAEVPCLHPVHDAIHFDDKFYLMGTQGLYVIPLIGPILKMEVVMTLACSGVMYLVELRGNLLLLERYITNGSDRVRPLKWTFRAEKINLDEKLLSPWISFEDYGIFLSAGSSPMVIGSDQCPQCNRNCIHVADTNLLSVFSERKLLSVYSCIDNTEKEYDIFHPISRKLRKPIWITPSMSKLQIE